MSSYGSGFAQGMDSGARFANSLMDIYDRSEKNKATSTLYEQGNIEGEKIRQQDMTNYNDQTASLFSGGYTPTAEEMGAIGQGATAMSEQKPSQLFSQSIMGMNSQERLGHMVTLAQQGGLKINNNTLDTLGGVNSLFDNAQKQDMEFEAKQFNMAEAQRAQQQAIVAEQQKQQGRNTLGELTYQTFKDDEKYKGLFGSIAGAGEGADMSRFADVAPLLFKDSQKENSLLNAFLISKMGNDTKKDIEKPRLEEKIRHNKKTEEISNARVGAYVEKIRKAPNGEQKLTVFDKKVQAVMSRDGVDYDTAAYALITIGSTSVKNDPIYGKTTTVTNKNLPPLPQKIPATNPTKTNASTAKSKYEIGGIYTVNGRKAKWDGKGFLPQ